MKNKVVLINPPTSDPKEPRIYFPFALLTLGGVLKELGVSTDLWDFDLYFKKNQNSTESHLRKMIQYGVKGSRTDIFGISCVVSNLPMALWMAKEIKACNPNSLIIFGGPQPSSVPETILERFEFVDVIVCGEGEKVLEQMVKVCFDENYLCHIPGVAMRVGGKIQVNPKSSLVSDMDEFPRPDYSLINFQDYVDCQKDPFIPNVEVGRGCPFQCTFCSTAIMWERNFRVKSPQRILEEMEELHEKYGFNEFQFVHDNFTTSRKFVNEFCDYMIENNKKGLIWQASSRVDCIDVGRLEKMHAAGLSGLFFGVETGSQKMQKVMKKNLKLESFEPVLKRHHELKINFETAFIFGFPEEVEEDIDATVKLALHYQDMGVREIFFSKLIALTGTSIYENSVKSLKDCYLSSFFTPQRYGLPYIFEIVNKYPDLFSYYYHVPHPLFSAEYLFKFREFAHLLIEGCPNQARFVINNLNIGANKLYSLWEPWAKNNNIGYYNYSKYSNDRFRSDFPRFLNEVLFIDESKAEIPSLALEAEYRPEIMAPQVI